MTQKPTIANAGNTEVPCYLVARKLGYSVHMQNNGREETWFAENDSIRFMASNHLELLGLIAMRSNRGVNWKASDVEINEYISLYHKDDL